MCVCGGVGVCLCVRVSSWVKQTDKEMSAFHRGNGAMIAKEVWNTYSVMMPYETKILQQWILDCFFFHINIQYVNDILKHQYKIANVLMRLSK